MQHSLAGAWPLPSPLPALHADKDAAHSRLQAGQLSDPSAILCMAPKSDWRRQARVQVMLALSPYPSSRAPWSCCETLNQTPGFGYISYSGSLFAHYLHLHLHLHLPAQSISLPTAGCLLSRHHS
jgi:hypothetical protein